VILSTPGSLPIRGQARAQFPLEQAEVVFNGKVVATVAARESDAIPKAMTN